MVEIAIRLVESQVTCRSWLVASHVNRFELPKVCQPVPAGLLESLCQKSVGKGVEARNKPTGASGNNNFLGMTDLSTERLRLRDQSGAGKAKMPSSSGKTENEGIRESAEKQFQRAGLILLFVGEAARAGGT